MGVSADESRWRLRIGAMPVLVEKGHDEETKSVHHHCFAAYSLRAHSSFYYDPDTTHIYVITEIPRNGKYWYDLRGSAKQGDAGTWQTLYQDTSQFYVSLDQVRSGILFMAKGKNIYKFSDYESDINPDQTPWQTLSNTIVGIYKYPGKDIVYALTDSSLLRVTPSGVYTLSRIPTGLDKPGIDRKPNQYELYQNYPNPFNPTTTIRYDLHHSGWVRLALYNVLGQQVLLLVNSWQKAGVHRIIVNATQLTSGVYLYRMQAGDKVSVKKMLLII